MAYSLSAIPGYDAANAEKEALQAQFNTLLAQRDAAAAEFGIASPQAQQYQQQANSLLPQVQAANLRVREIILNSPDEPSPTQTATQSQSTPPDTSGTAGQYPATGTTASASSQPGVTAPNDDNSNGPNTVSGTSAILNAGTNPGSLITPQKNILDQYASYTYNLGWYLLTPTQFAEITNATKLDVSQWSLLVQSGGAAAQQAGVAQQNILAGQTSSAVSGRNKYFTLDYYIDDLEINTTLGGGGPATLTEISFKVTEPNGLTLLPNLTNAVRDLYQESTAANNLAFYVMVVKFYGWDINGHLITDPTKTTGTPGAEPGVSNAIVTRYYPFQITEFNFKMANRAIEYQIKGTPQHFQYASSSGTASIPYNIELTGETVGDVLTGSGTFNVPVESVNVGGRETTNTPTAKSQVSPVALSATGADTNVTTDEGIAFNLLSG